MPFLIGGLVHRNKGTGVQLHVRCMQEQAILKDVSDASSVECNITWKKICIYLLVSIKDLRKGVAQDHAKIKQGEELVTTR